MNLAPIRRLDDIRYAPRVVRHLVAGGNGRDGHEVDIKISGNERATEIAARKIAAIDEIVDAINWVVTDISYKPPESVDFGIACMWARKLESALALLDPPTTTVDGTAAGAGPENQETPR